MKVLCQNPMRVWTGTAQEIVLQMTREDFLCGGKGDYMEEVKARLKTIYEMDIRFDSFETFLKELDRMDFITVEV